MSRRDGESMACPQCGHIAEVLSDDPHRCVECGYRLSRPIDAMRCSACGYDMRGLASDSVCPECGAAPTAPIERAQFRRRSVIPEAFLWLLLVSPIVLIVVIIVRAITMLPRWLA